MKNIKNSRLMVLFAFVFVSKLLPMRMTPQQVRQSKLAVKKIVAQGNQQSKTAILNELNKAGWSAEKIKEFRQKRDPSTKDSMYLEGKLVYSVKYSPTQKETPTEKAFNDMLIDHYAQKIYAALQAIPVTERAEWVQEFTYILHLGLNEFQKKGVERYKKGLLSVKVWADDGSEIGLLGTKMKH